MIDGAELLHLPHDYELSTVPQANLCSGQRDSASRH